MLNFRGEYGSADIMIDNIDQETISQIYEFLNNEVFTEKIVIMPDCHAGKGAVIGFTMPITDKIIPNIVGVDIGCGMLSHELPENILKMYTPKDIDNVIRRSIKLGKNVHETEKINLKNHSLFWKVSNLLLSSFSKKYNEKFKTNYKSNEFNYEWLKQKCNQVGIDLGRTINSIGSLGSGNHFIELGQSQNTNRHWLTIHSGSRQFGLKIANYWQKKAGKGNLAALSGEDMFGYLADMIFTQFYAQANRSMMMSLICDELKIPEIPSSENFIHSVHNYINFKDFIIRKGAISSYIGEKMLIPFNMEDGIIICEGKSNPDWNFSAPHGAGRVASRSWAKSNLNLEEAKQRMIEKDIYFSNLPIDELKGAYKDASIIENAIEPTATIVDRLRPILCIKD